MKKSLILLVAVAIIITVPFLWGEHISFNKKINTEKINAFATTLAVLLTSITVYLLYKQNQQQVEDRKAANQPELFPASVTYYSYDVDVELQEEGTVTVPFFNRDKRGDEFDFDSDNTLTLHNIGLGAAKHIKIYWEYDLNLINERIKDKYYKGVQFPERSQPYDFIAANSSININMSANYLLGSGKKVLETFKKAKDYYQVPLILKISFYDIYNNYFEKNFDVVVKGIDTMVFFRFNQI